MQILCEFTPKNGKPQSKLFKDVKEISFYDKAQGICLTFKDGNKCSVHIDNVREIKDE